MDNEVLTQPPETAGSFCSNCGSQLTAQQKFCPSCGHKTAIKSNESPAAFSKEKKGKAFSIVKSSLILAIAVFMLFSIFIPSLKIDSIEDIVGDDFDTSVKFNGIDEIKSIFSSFKSLDEDDLNDLGEDLEDDMMDYYSDWEDGDELDMLSKFFKKYLNLLRSSQEVPLTPGMVFSLILIIAQIAVSLLLVTFAALGFASQFTSAIKDFSNHALMLLGINAALVFVNAYAYKIVFLGDSIVKFSVAPALTLIIAALVYIVFAIINLISSGSGLNLENVIKRSLSAVFAVVLLCSAFAPIVNTEIKAVFDGDAEERHVKLSLDSAIFGETALTKDQKEALDDKPRSELKEDIKSTFSEFSNYTKKNVNKGKADTVNALLFSQTLLYFDGYNYWFVFAIGEIISILVVTCALIILCKQGYEAATGKRFSNGLGLTAKIVGAVMATALLALAVAMSAIVTNNAELIKGINYAASLAYGPILMVIFSIATACIPAAKTAPDYYEYE